MAPGRGTGSGKRAFMQTDLLQLLNRPAVKVLPAFSAGILLAEHGTVDPHVFPLSALVLFPAAFLISSLSSRRFALRPLKDVLLLLLVCAAGGLRAGDETGKVDTDLLPWADGGKHVTARGIVLTRPVSKPDRISFIVGVQSIDARVLGPAAVSGRCAVVVFAGRETGPQNALLPEKGDTLELRGKLVSARPARNPGSFDYRTWLRRQGMSTLLTASAGDVRLLGRPLSPAFPGALLEECRSGMLRAIRILFPPDRAALMEALLLGDRGMIDEETTLQLRKAGIIHILAVSGLHVGIALSVIWLPLGRLRYCARAPLALALLWIFVLLTGPAPPVLRAAVMATLVILGSAVQRLPHTMNSLAAAGILILAFSPLDLFQPGFQLSFAAVCSIVLFHRRISSELGRIVPAALREAAAVKSLVSLTSLTVAAQAGTLPLLAEYFGEVSIVSLAANLAAIPLVFVVVACGIIAVLLSPFGAYPAMLYATASDAALRGVLFSADALSSLPCAVAALPSAPAWAVILYVMCLLLLFSWRRTAAARLFAVAALSAAACSVNQLFEAGAREDLLRVSFLDVGQGDAVFVETPGGMTMLIDTGPSGSTGDAGERVIAPFLRSRGISRLDVLVVTHPDDDHIGGARSLIAALDVLNVWISKGWAPSSQARVLDSAARAESAAVLKPDAGPALFPDSSVKVYVLSDRCPPGAEPSANNSSLALLLRYGATSFLLTGDVDSVVENELVSRYGNALKCDVFKAGHHGSSSSNGSALLNAAAPEHAVISCGRNNRFGHPKPAALRRMLDKGAVLHRTDLAGAVIFESDGRVVRTSPMPH